MTRFDQCQLSKIFNDYNDLYTFIQALPFTVLCYVCPILLPPHFTDEIPYQLTQTTLAVSRQKAACFFDSILK